MLFIDSDGEIAQKLQGNLLRDYHTAKAKKEMLIKSRKNERRNRVSKSTTLQKKASNGDIYDTRTKPLHLSKT